MSTADHPWKNLDSPKRKLASNAGILREKNEKAKGVQKENGIKKRKQAMVSVTSSVVSKKHSTIYKNGEMVNSRYRVIKLIGTGSFGEVYRVADEHQRGQEVALKVEKAGKANFSLLKVEHKIYEQVKEGTGIPRTMFFGTDKKLNYPILIMECLGPSLQDMMIKCGGKFSCMTTALLADQMIERVEFFHSRHIVHRDIKPENFLISRKGTVKNNNVTSFWKRTFGEEVYLIDYGLAKRFRDSNFNHIRPANNGGNVTGTVRYTSIHSHSGDELSRRDDLESIAYILVYFLKGKLPWQNQPGTNKKAKHAKICELKMTITPADLCDGLSNAVTKCVAYCRSLGFEEVPDYAYLRTLFRKLIEDLKNNGVTMAYDWNFIGNSQNTAK